MGFTQKEKNEIYRVLTKKAPKAAICTICGKVDWTMQDGFIFLPIQTDLKKLTVGGKGIPFILLECKNCGNTHLLNVILLGLGHLFEEKKGERVG